MNFDSTSYMGDWPCYQNIHNCNDLTLTKVSGQVLISISDIKRKTKIKQNVIILFLPVTYQVITEFQGKIQVIK